jgi:peptidoglycan-N-acetylglucosamine deacetylase
LLIWRITYFASMPHRLKLLFYPIAIVMIAAPILYFIINSRTFQLFGKITSHINTEEKVVALTFDDGPTVFTDSVLMILASGHVRATFFLEGSALMRNTEIGKKIVSWGHEIGNHSFSHKRMIFTTYATVKKEIETTDSLVRVCGYTGEIFFRPPYCKKFIMLPYYLSRHNRNTITWDVEPEEGHNNSKSIADHVLKDVKPGSIILLHCMQASRTEARKALPLIIDGLRNEGYEFKTAGEMVQWKNN